MKGQVGKSCVRFQGLIRVGTLMKTIARASKTLSLAAISIQFLAGAA
jgi:hypothetical protein